MTIPRLLAISDPGAIPGAAWRRWCSELVRAGVDGLQVRAPQASDRDLLTLASESRNSFAEGRTLLVNRRFDIALAARADGVHLPADGLPVSTVRAALAAAAPRPALVGRSTHDPEEVRVARDEGADYVLFGPIFSTPSKAGHIAPRGIEPLREAVASGLPVLALGGIDAHNAQQVLDAGAWGLAAIRWFQEPQAFASVTVPLLAHWQRA